MPSSAIPKRRGVSFPPPPSIDDVIQDCHHPEITVEYFVADQRKDGGEYQECTGKVRHIDAVERTIVFLAENGRSAGRKVAVDDVLGIHGKLMEHIDDSVQGG